MSLTEYPDVVQGSQEWYDQRRGMVTSSVVGTLVTPKTVKPAQNPEARAIFALLVAERITGYTDPTYMGDDMIRGHEDEPRAVDVYSRHYEPVTTTGFMVENKWGYPIGYSPDGLVGDDGLVEIKSRRQKKHLQTILADEVPSENVAQIQCGLLVSGRKWLDFVSYCGGMPMFTKRVYPDPRWFEAIIQAVETFELAAAVMTEHYEKATRGLPQTERVIELEMSL